MSIKKQIFDTLMSFIRVLVKLIFGKKDSLFLAYLVESLTPVVVQSTPYGSLRFYCPGALAEWRAQTLLRKEPETIEWIDGFLPQEVFWDIGANIGCYSLCAATRGIRVVAIEPSPGNAFVLSRNIEANGFDKLISSYSVALNDQTRIDDFFMASTQLGSALNSFGVQADWAGEEKSPQLQTIGYGLQT